MEKLYDVLCDIHAEIIALRSDLDDIRREVENIRGWGGRTSDLHDVNVRLIEICDKLSEIN